MANFDEVRHGGEWPNIVDDYTEKYAPIVMRANSLTTPTVGIFDEPTRCYRINNEWSKIVFGIASILSDTKMWIGADNENHPAIHAINEFLIGSDCMDCNDILNCINTDTNYLALSEMQFNALEAATLAEINTLAAAYDGTPQSIAPDVPLTAPDADPDDLNLFCAWLNSWTDMFCATKRGAIECSSGLSGYWSDIRNATAKFYNRVSGVIAGVFDAELPSLVTLEDAIAALSDYDARREFSCCLLDELDSQVFGYAVFNAAISACHAALAGNAKLIAKFAMDEMSEYDVFLLALAYYQQTIDNDSAGLFQDCPCLSSSFTWEITADGCPVAVPLGWSRQIIAAIPCGTFGSASGILDAETVDPASVTAHSVSLIVTLPARNVTSVTLYCLKNFTGGDGTARIRSGTVDVSYPMVNGHNVFVVPVLENVSQVRFDVDVLQTYAIANIYGYTVNWS